MGKTYDADNGKVWLVLKDLMLRHWSYTYICHLDRLQNERAAIKALWAQYEGKSAMSQTKAQSSNTIKKVSFSGEKQNWTFKMYVTFHQKSHQILVEYCKPVSSAKQVWYLIYEINNSIRIMATALATLLATSNLCEDFQAASCYFLLLCCAKQEWKYN